MEANLVGRTLGGYRIIEQIGRGGMAIVYKAYEPALDRYVAIKVLPQYFAHDKDFAARFEREAKAVAQLDHPNILPIYGAGYDADLNYIVMRYVEAGTLKAMLAEPLDLKTSAYILGQIGRALEYAHRRGMVHRDVKPANVLMADDNWVLLTDFGLARMVESSVQLTKSGVGVGTPAYMSPEQGQGKKVDARTDVYSMGVVLYEMVTGKVPYDADTPMAIVIKHISAPLPLPRQAVPGLPESVERVILKAMAKTADDRFQTALEMVEALDKAVAGVPLVEAPAPAPPEPTEPDAPATVLAETVAAPPFTVQDVAPSPSVAARPAKARQGLPVWAWGAGAALALLIIAAVVFFATRGGGPETTPAAAGELFGTPTSTALPTPKTEVASPTPIPDDEREPSAEARDQLDRAWNSLEQGEYEQAIEHFNQAQALGVHTAELYFGRGWACHEWEAYEQGCGWEEALEDFFRAAELDPGNSQYHALIGTTSLAVGDPETAFRELDLAIELDPENPELWENRGQAHREQGELQAAADDYSHALDLDPENPWYWNARGNTWVDLGDLDSAIADLSRAIELMPDDAGYRNDRGWAFKTMGDHDAALADFDQALNVDPENPWAYRNRGELHVDMGEYDLAMADFNTAIELQPEDAGGYEARAAAYRNVGDFEAAIADLETAVRLDPEHPWYWNALGTARLDGGDPEAAIADLSKAIELMPEDSGFWSDRGWAFKTMGDHDAALAEFDQALKLDPENPWAYRNRAETYLAMGEPDLALVDFNRAVELRPEDPWSYGGRSWAHRDAGNFEAAVEDLGTAIQLDPEDPWLYMDRGTIYDESLGDSDRGLADLDRAVELAPDMANTYFQRGMFFLRHEDWESLIDDMTLAMPLAPDWPDLWAHRGFAYAELGMLDEARADLEAFVEMTADNPDYEGWRMDVETWLADNPP
jgi:tetratricopeptide (TPR) repeat protein/tRNA A-37 threonylcarbamoyl transferase component Bud32